MNLYKLRHFKDRKNIYRIKIAIEDSTLQIQRVTGSYRDYGNNEVLWSEVFFTYMTVIVALFEFTVSLFFTLALADFYRKIFDFAKVYWW